MILNNTIAHPHLGIETKFYNANISKVEKVIPKSVDEFVKRANVKGQFLNWVDLPQRQLERVDEFYDMAEKFKAQTNAKYLTVLGIGGSKHTVEHMLGINGLNVNQDKVLFYSDIDSVSFNRLLNRLDGDVSNSNYLVVSKSGSTFETKDGMLKIQQMLTDKYKQGREIFTRETKRLTNRHFLAVTDASEKSSELRRLSDSEGWLGDLYIHDDVGGRFSALDDHVLFTLAYAGMPKEDMVKMLKGAQEVSEIAVNKDIEKNMPLAQAVFWASERLNGIKNSVHMYLGSMFDSTEKWHAQMQNESIKDTSKQVAKITDAMHHSSEAWYNPANKFAFALTGIKDHGVAAENTQGYIGAIAKSNAESGPAMVELLESQKMGLKPETAGAMTQSRAFSTVYQEILEKNANGVEMPEVLDGVLQPNVEFYKKNLKPIDGNVPPVVAGRLSIIG